MKLTAEKVITWTQSAVPAGLHLDKIYLGADPFGLGGFQVATASSEGAPTREALRSIFTARKGKTQVQLVVAVTHQGAVYMFGPDPQAQPLVVTVEKARRQLQSVLSETDSIAATERMVGFRKAYETTSDAGFTNSGLFATHHIRSNLPNRADWATLNHNGQDLLTSRGLKLIHDLGFRPTPATSGSFLLSATTQAPRAVAVLLDDSENFDAKSTRFQLSPVAFGLAVAARHEVPWLVVLRKDQVRLYPGRDGVGVGAKGQAETYFEVDLSTVDEDFAALLPLIFSAAALAPGGTAEQLLSESARFATELGARLRERIYDEIVPPVAVEVAQELATRAGVQLNADGLATAYRVTLRILFRLLFQAYAEDRGLLPSGRNEGFDANSLKTNARRLLSAESAGYGPSATIWFDLVQVWDAIDQGNPQWQIPCYNGGLFASDQTRSPEGALLTRIHLPDRVLGPALKSLLIDRNADGVLGPVDFRSLSVREFGTIYEGLLESALSLADQDLTVDDNGSWIPAGPGDEVVVPAGEIYFHTASGERKATGSYFTKKVVVDHLIERSVVPALTVHLNKIGDRLALGDAAGAARDFFDFRVADLAMGSGHFLVAATDKIEALMRTFLTEHSVPGVTDELLRLADIAKEALGSDDVAKSDVDQVGLLRRQIARRCIYGLDINPMAVELARLALWIHTFVPGLPMSNLDHGLVNANSLTGIGSIDEALDALQPGRRHGELGLFDQLLTDQLAEAKTLLLDVANASEANKAEVEHGASMLQQARAAADTARQIFDAAVAARSGEIHPGAILDAQSLRRVLDLPAIAATAGRLHPAHLPYLYPEVFVRDDPGFDAVIGNPPWDKVRWEAAPFWTRVSPGLMALPDKARDARIEELRQQRPVEAAREAAEMQERERLQDYFKKVFPWRGGTHLELAQLMLERALKSVRSRGGVGLVLPRQSLVLAGWKNLRKELFDRHTVTLVQARNAGGWLFDGVDPRYAIVLLSAGPISDRPIDVAVVASEAELRQLTAESMIRLSRAELSTFSDTNVVPWFDSAADRTIFDKLRRFPKLSGSNGWIRGTHDARWDFRGAGPDRGLAVLADSRGAWKVMMTRHVDAFAIRDTQFKQFVSDHPGLVAKNRGVALDGAAGAYLSEQHPVVVVRHPSRSDDTRTLIAAALPRQGLLHNKGYIHAVAHVPGTSPEALLALIGVLNTNTEDWWARRFVDRHVTAPVINNLPLPDLQPEAITAVATRTAVLLHRSGYRQLAGNIDLSAIVEQSPHRDQPRDHLIAAIEATVARGYGLTPEDLAVIRQDFSADGMPTTVFELTCQLLADGAGATA